MTRQYWTNHHHQEGLIDNNHHIAMLIILNFMQPEIPMDDYVPYKLWKRWLKEQKGTEQ